MDIERSTGKDDSFVQNMKSTERIGKAVIIQMHTEGSDAVNSNFDIPLFSYTVLYHSK